MSDEQSNEWDAYAADWDDDEAARAYAAAVFESLDRLLGNAQASLDDARVLDFGCGTGLLTERLVAAGATVHAIDTSKAMLAVLDTKVAQNGWTNVSTDTALPAAEPAYDLIVCSSVCAFLDDYPATVSTLVECLRAGGIFVQWDWEAADDDQHGLSRARITAALNGAGLTDVSVGIAFSVPMHGETMQPLIGHGRRP